MTCKDVGGGYFLLSFPPVVFWETCTRLVDSSTGFVLLVAVGNVKEREPLFGLSCFHLLVCYCLCFFACVSFVVCSLCPQPFGNYTLTAEQPFLLLSSKSFFASIVGIYNAVCRLAGIMKQKLGIGDSEGLVLPFL